MRTKRFLTKTVVFLLCLMIASILIVPHAWSQVRGEIRGTVIDGVKQEPIAYTQVIIIGTSLGSITDFNGRYTISNVPPGTYSLQARFIGFRSQTKEVTVTAGEIATLDFALTVTAITMDEVVVTGTAIETERRSLGNTISTVSTRELGQVPVSSLSEVLQGRSPGLVALPSSGQAGSGASLRIRGMTSVSMTNEPIIYIDGVRVDNYQGETFFTTGGQRPSRINDISPSDVERVEVIKGASATTLYGTEASSGVIQIFTKRGTRGAPRINVQLQRGWVRLPEFDYGQMKVTQSLIDSLGRANPAFNIEDYPNLKIGSDPANSLIESAPYEAWEGSIRGGGDVATYYVSGRFENEMGSLPSNHYRRANFRANVDADVTDRLKIEARTGYVNNYLRRPNNDNNIFGLMGNAYLANLYRVRPGRPWGEAFTALDVSEKLKSEQDVHRFTGSVSLNYRPIGTWTHRLTSGIDVVNEEDTQFYPWRAGFPNYPDGLKYNHRRTNTRITFDYVSAFTEKISDQFTGQILGGLQGFFDSQYTATAQGENFPGPGVETVSAAATTYGYESRFRVVNAGYFFQGQLGWRERMYLTAGIRADGNSAFGEEFGLEYYPKVGLSYMISDEDFWPLKFWDNLKLRAAYGTAGKQPGAFAAQRTWSPIAALAGVPAVTPGNLGAPNLKPEKSHEIELGFDAGFFDDRYGVEFTYFDQTTRDALLLRRYPPSQGFLSLQLDNVGEVKNKGFEVLFRAIPVRTPDFETIFTLSFSKVDNEVTDMGGTADLPFGLGSIGKVKEGYPISSFFGRKVIGVTTNEASGFGSAQLSEQEEFLGQTLPKFWGSFSLNLTLFRNLRIYALTDWATGHVVYNNTQRFMSYPSYNTYMPMRELREKLADPNLTGAERVKLQEEFQYKDPTHASNYVEDADWLKIREIAITYTIPRAWRQYLGNRSANLTFAMRNIAIFTKYSGFDPEVNFAGQQNLSMGQDFLTVPQARRFIFTLGMEL